MLNNIPYLRAAAFLAATCVAFSTTPCLAADDFKSLLDVRGNNWLPLTAEEVADAHTCYAGGALLICAGEKRITTGILITDQLYGKSFNPSIPNQINNAVDIMFAVDAIMTIKQTVESGGPAWEKSYYVLSDEQFARFIEQARRDPTWKIPSGGR